MAETKKTAKQAPVKEWPAQKKKQRPALVKMTKNGASLSVNARLVEHHRVLGWEVAE